MIKRVSLAVFMTFLSSCTTVSYIAAVPPSQNSCLVYVFRDDFVLAYSNYIKVDGVTYAQLLDQSYTKFNLSTGEKEINVRWFPGSGGVNLDVKIPCLENNTHYVTSGGTYNYGYPVSTRRIVARQISKAEAESRMRSYRYNLKTKS